VQVISTFSGPMQKYAHRFAQTLFDENLADVDACGVAEYKMIWRHLNYKNPERQMDVVQ
jgi:hypothetical protein